MSRMLKAAAAGASFAMMSGLIVATQPGAWAAEAGAPIQVAAVEPSDLPADLYARHAAPSPQSPVAETAVAAPMTRLAAVEPDATDAIGGRVPVPSVRPTVRTVGPAAANGPAQTLRKRVSQQRVEKRVTVAEGEARPARRFLSFPLPTVIGAFR